MGLLRGLNGAPKRTSMGPLEGPHKREKVKQYLTRELRGHGWQEIQKKCPNGALRRPHGGLNRNPKGLLGFFLARPHRDLSKGPICTTRGSQWGPNRDPLGSLMGP
jgi:hypothetical protein